MMKAPSLSKSRRILFTIIMIFIPFIILAATELLLRLFGSGENYPLVYKKKIFGKEKYVVNRQIGQRYFFLPEAKIPEASEEAFDIVKQPGTLRIFCLGGSTTAGFPYEINATFPFQLKYRLKEALTENEVEVINLGISAVNSYTVLDLLPEVLELEPDILIIYMGHNEFYGAHGVGSTQYVSSSRFLVSSYLKLRRLRLTQLMENAIASLKSGGASEGKTAPQSMMQAMAGDQEIPLDSDKFRAACQNFEANLSEIIQTARQRKVQVLISNLVSNLKDQPPFVSKFSPELDEFSRRRCETLLLNGRSALQSGDIEQSLKIFSEISALDSSPADLSYYRGQAYLTLKDTVRAYQYFSKARDLDQLRFRAPGAFNRIIEKVAKQEDIPMVDMERVFAVASPAAIPGQELLLEHLHPNFNGYRLMAQVFLEALRSIQIINPPQPIAWKDELLSAGQIENIIKKFPRDSAGVTELDLEFGEYRKFFLVHRWPFPERPVTLQDYLGGGAEITKLETVKHFRENTYWDESHYELASYYLKQEQLNRAFREYRAVHLAFPGNYYPAMKMGDVLVMQQEYRGAKHYYERAMEAKPQSAHLLAKMGNLYVFANQFREAQKYFEEALKADSSHPAFSDAEKTNILYLTALSYANLKEWQNARKALDETLRLSPGFEPAEKLKTEMEKYISKLGRQ